jgi:aminopeptidase
MTAATDNVIDMEKLEKLAEVAVKIGLDLQKGQDLVITAPMAAAPLVRFITKHAYLAGGGLVTAFYNDEVTTLMRYEHAENSTFDRAAGWLYEGMAKAYANGAARLAISGDNPMLLSSQDPEKVARANRAMSMAYKPALEKISNFDINWNIVSYPNPSWARQMFPELGQDAAVKKLAHAIFAASRVDVADPVGAWRAHNAALHTRSAAFLSTALQGPGHRSYGRSGRWP